MVHPDTPRRHTRRDPPVRAVSAYEMGDCFRCDRTGIQVTHVGEIAGPEGETPLSACRACLERLLALHLGAHENPVRQYVRQ